ncbi:MAG: late promoter transcription accessory protein [Candidatus Nanopelagicaceae bacterium]
MSVFDNFLNLNIKDTMDKEVKQELKKVLQEKFYCPSRFAQEIERVVQEEKVSYIDAIIYFCDRNKIDLESVPKLLSKPLKEKIKCEAINLNFLKKTSKARLVF